MPLIKSEGLEGAATNSATFYLSTAPEGGAYHSRLNYRGFSERMQELLGKEVVFKEVV